MFYSQYKIDVPIKSLLDYLFPDDKEENLDDKPIWVDAESPEEHRMSQKGCFTLVKRLGCWLSRSIVRGPGEIVMVVSPNNVLFPAAYLGIIASGAAFSGCNPAYTPTEIAHQLKHATAVLVHPSCVAGVSEAARLVGMSLDRVFLFQEGSDESQEVSGIKDWRSFAPTEKEAMRWRWKPMDAGTARRTLGTVNYSSGTTGGPKGVMISHANLIANTEQSIFMRDIDSRSKVQQDRWIGFLPLFHAFGQMYTILIAAKTKTPVYIMKKFDFLPFMNVLEKYKITQLHCAPPILVMLNARPETAKYDLSSLTEILCGAAPLSSSLQNSLHKKYGFNIKQGWGMTELVCGGMHVGSAGHDDSGSVGKLDPNCEAKLLDDDGKEILSVNTPGELYIRGPNVCLGYYKNQQATAEAITDGWLRTGDVASVDERGNWYIVDRRKELIKVRGFQVAPAELEAVLLENPDVADCAVVAFEMAPEKEVPRAYVQMKPDRKRDERAIQDWVASKVSPHKQLAGGVAFVNEVPKLPSGKIVRKVMREWSKRDSMALRARL